MKNMPALLAFLLVPLLFPLGLQAAGKPAMISMHIPGGIIEEALQKTLPLPLDTNSSAIEGSITVVGISKLRLHDNRVSGRLDLLGENLTLVTDLGEQKLRLQLGSAQAEFDIEAELRFDAAAQTLYLKPVARQLKANEAKQEGDIGQALALFLNGREFPVTLQDIEPIVTETPAKIITIATRIARIDAADGALRLGLVPAVSTKQRKR